MNDIEQMKSLVAELNRLAFHYYTLGTPQVSDAEYDKLLSDLQAMEKETGVVLPDSPSLRVGGEPLKEFRQYKHRVPLLSMDKAQEQGALDAWLQRVENAQREVESVRHEPGVPPDDLWFAVEPKFDGLTISLIYQDGVLVEAATRGNGEVGESVLEQARTIRSIPLSLPLAEGTVLEVQGEAVMTRSAFKAYNDTAATPLKNPRNGVAGALRNLDPRITAQRNLSAFFYNISYTNLDERHTWADNQQGYYAGMISFLRHLGFDVGPSRVYCQDGYGSIEHSIQMINKMRATFDFDIDGAVIKVCNLAVREAMGSTNRFPRWALAWKYPPEEKTTTLRDVSWEVGRTGKVTPVALLEPVELSGATVERATLNNWNDMQRKAVKIGGRVWVRRSNEVIPEVIAGVEESGGVTPELPQSCPACGHRLEETGAHLFCPNRLGCPAQIIGAIAHFCSRDAMDIDGLSDETVEALYREGLLRRVSDIYYLHFKKERLAALPGFGKRKVDKLILSIGKSMTPTLRNFIYALGIPGVGLGGSKNLSKKFGDFVTLLKASLEDIASTPDVGEKTASDIVDFFADPGNVATINELLAAGVTVSKEEGASGEALRGKTIVVTGTLPTLGRKEAEALIEANGGKSSGSVSVKTSYVLAGEAAGSKLDKAKSLGVPVLTEQEFLDLLHKA